MTGEEDRDRLIDTLLDEVLGGDRPPDLREEILRRAAGGRRAWGRLTVGLAAAVLLAVGLWIVIDPGSPADRTPGANLEEPIVTAPLPPEVREFRGYVAGTVVSIDPEGLVLRVTKATGSRESKATHPARLEGRKVRLRFANSRDLPRQAEALRSHDGPVTADVWTERDEPLYATRLRTGDHADR